MMDWALQLTLFLGCFVLTEHRINSQRYDCLCCIKRKTNETADSALVASKPVSVISAKKDSGVQAVLDKCILPAIFHPAGKIIILLNVVALAVVGGIGSTRLREGLPLGTLAPDGHYFRDFDDAITEFSQESGIGATPSCA
jgi:Patched family